MESQNNGLRLLKKGQKGIHKMIFGRMGLVLLLLLLNIGLLFALFLRFEEFMPQYFGGTALFTAGMVLYLINSPMDPTAKNTWLVVIALSPVFGSLLYLFTQAEVGHKALGHRLEPVRKSTQNLLPELMDVLLDLAAENPGAAAMVQYVQRVTGVPVYQNTQATYFPLGERMLEAVLRELEQAKTYIYLEFFIIDEGVMWGKILEVLTRKAAQGVDVRVMYDGTCEFLLLPKGYGKKLNALGIQCQVFSPVTPIVSTHYNYRDHRKILVIDGKVAFTGGVNLADEYINEKPLFGHWKDTAVMLKGEAAQSFTLMFLKMWHLKDNRDIAVAPIGEIGEESNGYVLPYYDDPLDRERLGRQVYLDILARARRYVHIMTPYLILDRDLEDAICYAAKRGVQVTLLLPGIPDKRIPYALAKSHYPALLEAGVQIYEYTPGFVHAKVFVSDDREAVVGTINLDYRSLYHHFECAVYLYGASCVGDIEGDFVSCIGVSRQVTAQTVRQEKWYIKATARLLKAAAPLL